MKPSKRGSNYSNLRHIIELVKAVEDANTKSINTAEAERYIMHKIDCDRDMLVKRQVRQHVDILNSFLTGPRRKFEFVAKVLLHDYGIKGKKGTIATPLYVSLHE